MALRQIVKDTDPQIRKHSREVTSFDKKLATLLDDMRETMLKNDGVGLAGIQVGILRRVAVVETSEDFFRELINPVILEQKGEQEGIEGCLSVDNYNCYVIRPNEIKLKYFDRYGVEHVEVVTGFDAR